ncbi:MAG: acyl-CoA carboxylase subunit epsilon [Nocardioidaceae bacterium]
MSDGETTPRSVDQTPLLRVVRGVPDDAELAALVAVVACRSGGGNPPSPGPEPLWSSPARAAGAPLWPGHGAWRASAMPR